MSSLALVTGAASGIGRAFALELAARGWAVLLVDVDAVGLEATAAACAATAVHARVVDLTDRHASIEIALALEEVGEPLALLVCCAGVLGPGRFGEQPLAAFARVVEVNLLGTARTIHGALDALRRARGQIVLLGSTASLHGWPLLSAYSASKGAVENLGEALRAELAADGVGVTTVFPLLVETPMLAQSDLPPILRGGRVRAETVVARALRGAARRRRRVYVPFLARLVALVHGLWPRLLDRWAVRFGVPRARPALSPPAAARAVASTTPTPPAPPPPRPPRPMA